MMVTKSSLCADWRAANSLLRRSGLENFVERGAARGFGPSLRDTFADGGVTRNQQARGAVLHHGGEFGGRLARIERDDDDVLGHQSEINRGPAIELGPSKAQRSPACRPAPRK